jgi:hypothetical protein
LKLSGTFTRNEDPYARACLILQLMLVGTQGVLSDPRQIGPSAATPDRKRILLERRL